MRSVFLDELKEEPTFHFDRHYCSAEREKTDRPELRTKFPTSGPERLKQWTNNPLENPIHLNKMGGDKPKKNKGWHIQSGTELSRLVTESVEHGKR